MENLSMLNRINLAAGLLACVLASPAAAAVAGPPVVSQAEWNGLKKEVRLPNGVKLAYVELGDPAGEPVLLLHGYTDSSRSWSITAPYLSRYRLIIPDQRGHGAADAPPCCYALSNFAYDARLLLDELGIRRAAVVGHSLGSMIAMTMAAEYPDRISSITLIGSTALVPVKPGDWLYDNTNAMRTRLDPASQFAKDWHPANQPTAVDPAFANAVNEELYAIEPHVWRSVMRELTHLPVGRHAQDIKAPVLVISGGKDPLFPAPHHAALLKAFPQAETHVFPELGHNPNWEQPKAVAERLDAFLRKNR
jgi:pimeloyl-ACP methyl ester carboxylesterase